MQGGGDNRVRPTALDVLDVDGNPIYSGAFRSDLSFSGQGFADDLLMYIYFDLADISDEELMALAENLVCTNCRVDETAIDEEAYVSIYTTEAIDNYSVSYSGDEHIAPFRVDILFD